MLVVNWVNSPFLPIFSAHTQTVPILIPASDIQISNKNPGRCWIQWTSWRFFPWESTGNLKFSHGKKKGVPVIFPVIFPTNPLMNPWNFGVLWGPPKWGHGQGIGCCKEPTRNLVTCVVFASVCHKIPWLKHVETKKTPTFDPWWFSPVSVGSFLGCLRKNCARTDAACKTVLADASTEPNFSRTSCLTVPSHGATRNPGQNGFQLPTDPGSLTPCNNQWTKMNQGFGRIYTPQFRSAQSIQPHALV